MLAKRKRIDFIEMYALGGRECTQLIMNLEKKIKKELDLLLLMNLVIVMICYLIDIYKSCEKQCAVVQFLFLNV